MSTITGTPYFMPPEQFHGDARDGRTDIYALGVTLYYLLTLRRPFEGRTPADNQTVRSVFLVGPDKKIKLSLTYPMTTGRNFDELLRTLDSVRLTANHKVATPANWQQGEDVIITAAVSDEEATEKFGEFERVLPYIRKTAQPA